MIEFRNIEIKYGKYIAITNLNLTVQEGEFFTLLGPSGCGKSTTLRGLVGFTTPSKGQMLLRGKDITYLPVEKREIGIVFQSYALFPTMNVFDNIAFGLKIKKLSKQEIEQKVKEISRKVELNQMQLYKNVSELSGGQQQRVAIARALVLEPSILCLDEPLSNLDAKLRGQLRLELKRLQKELGITTIYVTHDQEEALTLSDRIAVFNNGCIEQVGTPYEIYNHSSSEFVCDFIGDINRFKKNILELVNEKTGLLFNVTKDAFIRIERVHTNPVMKSQFVEIKGRVIECEYNGIYTKYTYSVMGETIKSIEKNDGRACYNIGQKVPLYVDPKDIMQFGG